MKPIHAIIATLVAVAVSFLAGRFSAPVKTVEKEKVVERKVFDEQLVANAIAAAKAEWTKSVQDHSVVRIVYRDGKPIERTVYVDRETRAAGSSEATSSAQTTVTAHESAERTAEHEKIIETTRPGWRGGIVAWWIPLDSPALAPKRWSGEIDRRLAGTLWAGARLRPDFADWKRSEIGAALSLEW